MSKPVHQRLHEQLPFTIVVLGRRVSFKENEGRRVGIHVEEQAKIREIRAAMKEWDRRSHWIDGPDERDNLDLMEARFLNKDHTIRFLQFFLAQPIGQPLCIFDTPRPFEEYPQRLVAINEAFLTWDAINHWPRKPNGKMKLSISCGAFISRIPAYECQNDENWQVRLAHYRCVANVSDVSGFCGSHKKQGAKTLFNFYPFFKTEGFPELTI